MGNCAVTQHAVSWADDGEWELPSAQEKGAAAVERTKEQQHMTEVTIRITKRQLQELIEKRAAAGNGNGNGNGNVWKKSQRSAAELLADIMNAGQVYHNHIQHCRVAQWKPALQSIPEAVES